METLQRHQEFSKKKIIHSDVLGPINKSVTGKSYILTFLGEYSRKSWIYRIEKKSEVSRLVIQFFNFIKTQFHHKIKYYKTDNIMERSSRTKE